MKCMGNGLPKIVHQQILKTYNTGWDTDDNKYNLPQNIKISVQPVNYDFQVSVPISEW